MLIFIDARNQFKQMFVIKSKSKFLQLAKIINEKSTASIILGGKSQMIFALKWGRKQGCVVLTVPTRHYPSNCSIQNKTGKRIRSILMGKEKVKLPSHMTQSSILEHFKGFT